MIVALLLSGMQLVAQEITGLDRLQIDLWPEYDRPAMLVILRGIMAEGTVVPATITLPMPCL